MNSAGSNAASRCGPPSKQDECRAESAKLSRFLVNRRGCAAVQAAVAVVIQRNVSGLKTRAAQNRHRRFATLRRVDRLASDLGCSSLLLDSAGLMLLRLEKLHPTGRAQQGSAGVGAIARFPPSTYAA